MKNEEIDIDEWAVYSTPGKTFLGKMKEQPIRLAGNPSKNREDWKKEILDAISQGDVIELSHSMDFSAPIRPVQVPGGGIAMSKDPIVTSLDFTMSPVPHYIKAVAVYFCYEMQKADREVYKGFVQQTIEQGLKMRAARSGIEMVGNMPAIKGGQPGRG